MNWQVEDGTDVIPVACKRDGDRFHCRIGKRTHTVTLIDHAATTLTCHIDGHRVVHADIRWNGDQCQVMIDHVPYNLIVGRRSSVVSKSSNRRLNTDDGRRSHDVRAPMPARVVDIRVKVGDRVTAGQAVLVVEAMKMQNELHAPTAGTVTTVHVSTGQAVEALAPLVTVATS